MFSVYCSGAAILPEKRSLKENLAEDSSQAKAFVQKYPILPLLSLRSS